MTITAEPAETAEQTAHQALVSAQARAVELREQLASADAEGARLDREHAAAVAAYNAPRYGYVGGNVGAGYTRTLVQQGAWLDQIYATEWATKAALLDASRRAYPAEVPGYVVSDRARYDAHLTEREQWRADMSAALGYDWPPRAGSGHPTDVDTAIAQGTPKRGVREVSADEQNARAELAALEQRMPTLQIRSDTERWPKMREAIRTLRTMADLYRREHAETMRVAAAAAEAGDDLDAIFETADLMGRKADRCEAVATILADEWETLRERLRNPVRRAHDREAAEALAESRALIPQMTV